MAATFSTGERRPGTLVGRLKAASLINNIAIAREVLGEGKLGELLKPLPEETRALFGRRLLAVEWIDADEWLAFQQAMLDVNFGGDEARMRQLMHKVCERDFNTFYKIILKLSSARTVLTRAPKIWMTYAEPGELQVAILKEKDGVTEAMVRLIGFETNHQVFAVLLHAFIEQVLRMTGAREIDVKRTRLDHSPGNARTPGRLSVDLLARFRD